jgi:hypothetical protein
VDEVGLDVAQDPRVVGDEQDAQVGGLLGPVDALGDDAQRVDVEAGVGLVEDGEAGLSSSSWRISWRFFSPPEKPSLTLRSAKAGSIFRRPWPP